MNFTGWGFLAWKKAKWRDQKIWKAACEYWLEVAKEHDQEMQFMIEDELDDE